MGKSLAKAAMPVVDRWRPDPHPTGLRRADGTLPYNDHLWPTESWWLGHEFRLFDSRWHFGYVALADGRFSTTGCTYSIVKGIDSCDYNRCCVFTSRTAAIRASAARLIRTMRYSKNWSGMFYGGMSGKKLAFAINWTLNKVAIATGSKPHRMVIIPDPIDPATLPKPIILPKRTATDPWSQL